jgi:hypothetical protein
MTGDHDVLAGVQCPNDNAATRTRDQWSIVNIQLSVERNTKELQTFADRRTYDCGVLANSTGKDQRIQSAEDDCVRADELPHLVAKCVDRVTGRLVRSAGE